MEKEKLNKLCMGCTKKCKQLFIIKVIKCPNYKPIPDAEKEQLDI